MLVIGNGESRKGINIDDLDVDKVGCNAVFRDFNSVRHIVCVDKRMVNEAISHGANLNSFIYTREDWIDRYKDKRHIRLVPDLPYVGSDRVDEPFQWGSGPYAVLLAAKKSTQPIGLLGFDLYGIEGKTNNIYKDTLNYNISEKRAVDPRYWIYQISKVFQHFPKKRFVVYADKGWKLPKEWKNTNVSLDKISNLV